MKYFGYTKGIGGKPCATIWHETLTDGNGKELTEGVLQKFVLPAEDENLSFAELKLKYPYKDKETDAKP